MCRQERGESIETYYNRVRILAAQAFRAENNAVIEKRAREAFLDGLDDSIRYNVKDKDPKTCKEAFDEAIRQNILREDRRASQQRRLAGHPKVQQTNAEAVRNHQIHRRPAQVNAAATEDLQAQLEVYKQQVAELQRLNGALLAESGAHGVRSLAWPKNDRQEVNGKQNFTVNSAHIPPMPLTAQIPIKVNGNPCFALVDTGSTITVASQSFSKRIGIPKLYQASAPHAIGLGGNAVQMVGAAFVTFSIGSHTVLHRVHFTKGECTPAGPRDYDIILGNDILSQLPQFSIDYKQATLHIGREIIPIGTRHVTVTLQVFDVKVSEEVVIPACSEKFIRCVKPTTAVVRASVFLVASQNLLNKSLLTAPAVVDPENVCILVTNTSDSDVTLLSGTKAAEVVEIFDDESGKSCF
uniref:Peptidase A2 domain-containing protein n=1 Tax=Caenorhabditis japonica TaxID=281687 RepID=A0A8R1I4V5_CAEJA